MIENNKKELVFLPLGGVGEIGMNLALYGYGTKNNKKWIIVDFGVSFADSNTPGVDLVFPKIDFLLQEKENIEAIILTHAHEDHYGALLDLWSRLELPVYASPFTNGLLQSKCARDGNKVKIPVTIFQAGDVITRGDFTIEAVSVTHSIPEPMSLAIKTPLGTVVHTGDWKIDLKPADGVITNEQRFTQIGDEGVLALVCDSTNALVKGSTASEEKVKENITGILKDLKGRAFVAVFSSNIGRIYSIALAAQELGRKVMLVGRSIQTAVNVAKELGYLSDLDEFVSEAEYSTIERDKLVVIITGSQGENRAALSRLARGEMKWLAFAAGDTVIYSARAIPGNEKAIVEVQNNLVDLGVNIIEAKEHLIHVSGHPSQDDLAEMYQWVRPEIIIPVHGESIHLRAHAEFARSKGIKEVAEIRNGNMLRLAPKSVEVIDNIEVGRLYKDGLLVGNEAELGIAERRKLIFAGHITVFIILNKQGKLAFDPDIIAIGVPTETISGENFNKFLQKEVISVVNGMPNSKRLEIDGLKESVRRAVRANSFREWGKKPITTVFIHQEK